MNKRQKEVLQTQLDHEKEVIDELKKVYEQAQKDIEEKIKRLMADELTQSKIYQIEYQKALRGQIGAILENLNSKSYESIHDYLKDSYEDAFIGNMYDLQGQGIPLIIPINQEQVVKAIQLDSKLSGTLYEAMGVNVKDLKKRIASEVSRGISNGFSYRDMARNLNNAMGIGLNKSIRIARTEAHRVSQQSTMDAMRQAKDKGADVVKQWDATLDAKTRPSHQKVDGEIKELDEPFGNGLMFPGDPHGSAGEVINCRCVALQRARWALDDDELETLKERAEYFGLDKSENFKDFKQKYLEVADNDGYNDIEDIIIPRSVGASGKNYPVKLPNGNHAKFAVGTAITRIKVFAGKGTDTAIKDAAYLEADYGIAADEWQKLRGDGFIVEDGEVKHVEIHWYEADGERFEMKVKRYFDDES
jgi:SPP1 gp7 family putative phage head morphogenesis protein